jgi:hypothetical protein
VVFMLRLRMFVGCVTMFLHGLRENGLEDGRNAIVILTGICLTWIAWLAVGTDYSVYPREAYGMPLD